MPRPKKIDIFNAIVGLVGCITGVAALTWQRVMLSSQCFASHFDGIQLVRFAARSGLASLRPVTLVDDLAASDQETRQPSPVAAGALHDPGPVRTAAPRPLQELNVAALIRLHIGRAKDCAQFVDQGRAVALLMGVHAHHQPLALFHFAHLLV